mgnify:CR=1 FL=1
MMRIFLFFVQHLLARTTFIIDGEGALSGEFQYQLSLWYDGMYFCGGAILGTYFDNLK